MTARTQHLDVAILQSRHRVLCGILDTVEPGRNLINRARILGMPVDWDDHRHYPNRHGYSDFGATFLLAKDVCRAETARSYRMRGGICDPLLLDSHASHIARQEATMIFNHLIESGIELSGIRNGRFYTSQEPVAWRHRPNAGMH